MSNKTRAVPRLTTVVAIAVVAIAMATPSLH